MPNHDGTGPLGDGRPGRGLGPCGRMNTTPNNPMRRGFRKGMRRGLGVFSHRGWMNNAETLDTNPVYEYDKNTLNAEKTRLERLLNWIQSRLAEIDE